MNAGGNSLAEALAQVALAQWGYMTDPNSIKIDPECDRVIEASGRDPITLLYNFMDKCLYEFTGDDFLAQELTVLDFICPSVPHAVPAAVVGPDADDRHRPESERCYIRCSARGERFVFGRHPQGTEVKAVTFSNMQIVVEAAAGAGGGSSEGGTAYSGVSEVVRGGVTLCQYSANEAEELGQGIDVSLEQGGAQTVAAASAMEARASGEGSGVPGLSAAAAAALPSAVSAPTGPASSAAAAVSAATAAVQKAEEGPQGDEESVCSPAGGAGLPFDAHAASELLGTRRGPVDVYVIVDI